MRQGIWWHVIFILTGVINICSILWLIPKLAQRSRVEGRCRFLCPSHRRPSFFLFTRTNSQREASERKWSPLGGIQWNKFTIVCNKFLFHQFSKVPFVFCFYIVLIQEHQFIIPINRFCCNRLSCKQQANTVIYWVLQLCLNNRVSQSRRLKDNTGNSDRRCYISKITMRM